MKDKDCRYSLRIDMDVLAKFRSICDYEGVSANSQLNILIRKFIREYEKENGEIIVKRKPKEKSE